MSVESYRAAAERLRDAMDLLGPYRMGCFFCGHPDARHRQADAITDGMEAGDTPATVADEYLGGELGETVALLVAVAVLMADPRRHRLTKAQAFDLDREIWAEKLTKST